MRKNYRNNRILAVELLRGKWLLHQPEAALPAARSFLAGKSAAAIPAVDRPSLRLADANLKTVDIDDADSLFEPGEQRVLILPVHGILTKYDNCIGCSTLEVADWLDLYREDDNVCGFILDIDSPGGSANSVMILLDAIRRVQKVGKSVIAHVDQCCSAAYWIASQCDAIYADNRLSELGSIGAYTQLIDDRNNLQTGEKIISVYAPQSVDKNKAFRDALDGKPEEMESELGKLVDVFQEEVKAGRPDLKAEANGVLSGKVFLAPEAVELGLANGIADMPACIDLIFAQNEQ